mmetsp:Transcript_24112/g.36513  ORF Transcript_24112/g.36513 Transcript_24112/m.36513 type:complete len:143 (+) Transcript_24112:204-632(+)
MQKQQQERHQHQHQHQHQQRERERERSFSKEPWPPPEPVGEAPALAADGAFKTKDDACAACKFKATGSCAMYKTCRCHATNSFFGIVGLPEPLDQDNWHWSCGAEGGDKYTLCFKTGEVESGTTYLDNFGDEVDPNKPKCPV